MKLEVVVFKIAYNEHIYREKLHSHVSTVSWNGQPIHGLSRGSFTVMATAGLAGGG